MDSVELTHEAGLIGSILLDSSCLLEILDVVSEEDFTSDTYRAIYKTAVNLYMSGVAVDPLTIAGEMKKDNAMTADTERLMIDLFQMTATTTNAGLFAKGIRSEANMRRIRQLLESSVMEHGDPDSLTDAIMEGLYCIERGGKKGRAVTLDEAISDFKAWAFCGEDAGRINLGYGRLDKILRGMNPGNLILLAARPGVGKSAFAADLALRTAKRGRPTAIFSCEMSTLEIVQRYMSNAADIDLNDILEKSFLYGEPGERATEAAREMSSVPLHLYDEPGITVADIRRTLQTVKDIGFVVVDYIQLMRSLDRSENRNLEVAKISGDLKKLAREFKIPVMALSQLNRGKREDDEPGLEALRDSGALEQDADIAIFIWKLEPPKQGEFPKMGVKIAKNRMGQTGTVVMYYNGSRMKFLETAEEYAPEFRGHGRKFHQIDLDLPEGWQ